MNSNPMTLTPDLMRAARSLGAALNASPAVQDYLQAAAAASADAEIQRLEAETDRVYRNLVARQQSGQMLHPHEVNDFYHLRDLLVNHPLVLRRESALEAVKALFEQTGQSISSILTVDYTELAG